MSLAGKTILMSGGSRGIGLAVALRAAADGANVALLAKTDTPHATLPGTIHTAARQIEDAGGQALAVVGDVRSEGDIARAVAATAERFGGIDIVINNASAIDLGPSGQVSAKSYDLMQDVNTRGTFLLSRGAAPVLRASDNAHILTFSPPINLAPHWPGRHLAYTISKYGMSLCTLGLADELRSVGIAANSLWPRTVIDTAATSKILGPEAKARTRTAEIMADAAHWILEQDAAHCTGNHFLDEDVLRAAGVEDFSRYGNGRDDRLLVDVFVDG